ncbi:MAG TPA: hypothetical protein VFE08_15240 [Candidatus Sulfotelmatobacter sp.]|nr:hypothetical protein [Candidatus Sulfotelmatobacter sp.]
MSSPVLKTLKRSMAAEYIRELFEALSLAEIRIQVGQKIGEVVGR